eukprot:CAMPEP_0114373288 /NCGR_PEP_ID=MMETSP0101-20121206/34760_1 /TAXON_ID=38822 ORGANISM="Pteridomonas danica, Strain PT" /NCGR_SAMPLE_ID=MMETSP0101 /ASSEMBLY_ACC=CAM_ASM_000211 /LENGTH=488 /DNA_ID=CAMNT_0001526467 /DNA_START=43 /DNA_END=1510 /DNA_ORIENTATION=-
METETEQVHLDFDEFNERADQAPQIKSFGDVMMQSAMLWGASQNKSADLLFEEAGLKPTTEDILTNHQPDQPPIEEYLTTNDLPTRISGGDPMHMVSMVTDGGPDPGEPIENAEWSVQTKDFTIGGTSLLSAANLTDYSLPEWIVGGESISFPDWEPLTCVMNTTRVFRDLSEVLPHAGERKNQSNRRKVGGRLPAPSPSPLYTTSTSTMGSSSNSVSSMGSNMSSSKISSSPFASSRNQKGGGGSSGNQGNKRVPSDPKKKCRLPYANKTNNLVTVKASTATLLAKERAIESRKRMNAQMIAERDAFMNKLNSDRSLRLYEETEAAIKIQSLFRGYKARPHSEATCKLKSRLIEQRAIERGFKTLECSALTKLDDKLNLSYIEGVTLPKLKKTKKQLLAEQREHAILEKSVVLLQGRARILNAKICVIRLMEKLELFRKEEAVINVQRVARGGKIRKSIVMTKKFKQQQSFKLQYVIQLRNEDNKVL